MNPSRRLVVVLAVLALGLLGCQVRRVPSPERTRQLRVADVRRLVDQPVLSPAAWSADGRRLAFSDGGALYVASAEGRVRRIAPASVATAVSWSHPLDLLAVVDRGELWILRPDGSERRRLDLPGFVTAAVWAPAGDRLGVVVRRPIDGVTAFELWLVTRDGGFRRAVTRAPAGMAMRELQWFPNGLYLLYGLAAPSEQVVRAAWQVRVAYPDQRAVPLPGPALHLRLSPSGRAIAYVAGEEIEDGRGQVVASRLDGTGRFVVTPEPGRYSGLAWSPQGDKLAFADVTDEAHAEIWIADGDATGRLAVHSYTMEFSDPSIALSLTWAPEGRRLLFGTNSGTFQGPLWLATLVRR